MKDVEVAALRLFYGVMSGQSSVDVVGVDG